MAASSQHQNHIPPQPVESGESFENIIGRTSTAAVHHHPNNNNKVEITRAEAMRSFLTDEIFSDLILRSSDGMAIKANRCMLAARSTVFRRMLFGEFAEATQKEIQVGYKGNVLSSVVEFIYTEHPKMLILKNNMTATATHSNSTTTESSSSSSSLLGKDDVPSLLSLVDAADYFAIPELRRKTESFVGNAMARNNSLVGVFLSACESYSGGIGIGGDITTGGGGSTDGDDSSGGDGGSGTTTITSGVEDWAHIVIATDPTAIATNFSLHLISSVQLRNVLQMDALKDQELYRFHLIQAWADMGSSTSRSTASSFRDDEDDDEAMSARQCRKRKASELTLELNLEKIGPRDLSVSVEPSGLVTTEQILHAYKAQALSSCYRRSLVWQSSNNNVCDFRSPFRDDKVELLTCEKLTSGIHKWSILVEAENRYAQMWLGIAHTGFEIDCDEWLGDQDGGWVYGDQGSVFHSGLGSQVGHPSFGGRSTVTFTLDLTGDGILHASVDDNPDVILFSSLHDDVDYVRGNGGFVPAVSVSSFPNGRVRFLGFTTTEHEE